MPHWSGFGLSSSFSPTCSQTEKEKSKGRIEFSRLKPTGSGRFSGTVIPSRFTVSYRHNFVAAMPVSDARS